MIFVSTSLNVNVLAARWWVPVVRGIAAVLFGALAVLWPSLSTLALVLTWAALAVVDGVFGVVLAADAGAGGRSWGLLLFESLVGIGAGMLAFISPGMTMLAFAIILALRSVFAGVAQIFAAIQLRRSISGEWLMALSGILTLAFGVLMAIFPLAGIPAFVTVLGIYAMAFGSILVSLGLRLRQFATSAQSQLAGGKPSHVA